MGPHPPKPKVLLWADVSYTDMEEIDNTKSIPELKRVLCKVLGIQMSQQPMASILSDLYFHALIFSRVKRFSREQTSVLLSIMKAIHATNVETPLNNMDQCFTNCSELLLCHSSKRPPFSIDLFNSEQMMQILQYLVDTYFRHFLLYKYIFTAETLHEGNDMDAYSTSMTKLQESFFSRVLKRGQGLVDPALKL